MQCYFCNHTETKVTNKRDVGQEVRRRRECLKCRKRFTTYEHIELSDFHVIKKDGRREKFNISKLQQGINRAFEKRPVSKDEIQKIINEIEENLRKRGKEVRSTVIGELVMKKLEKMDKVAYVRFASVYKDFQDVNDFKRELRGLRNGRN